METKLHSRFYLAVMLLAACITVDANAQSVLPKLTDRDKPNIEIYPKYPVSITTEPGVSNDGTAVVATVYRVTCYTTIPELDEQKILGSPLVTIDGFNVVVKRVRYGFSPLCGFLGANEGPVVQSIFLGNFGPGVYKLSAVGEPGDNLDGQSMNTTTLTKEFVVLTLEQAGKALIENPSPGSTQSGVGLISGWACVADRVEISIDGGERVRVGGESARGDVTSVCGHQNAGFSQLLNFNLLGEGEHTLQLFVKDVAIGEPTRFTVVVPAGEFIRGLKREAVITDFPSAGKNAIIDWRESEQNFRLREIR
ncbi:conserved exported hypothetical protein [Candidatus Nitrotoga sp. BS]|uniref:hypothetical protein n=1 Tax=Candidatus Nitrotoga sp. BS TaxID=2890408 RepID=UPI001EF1C6F9|nr:hypothetical protein [Candidatus Nitrotoga sp. BS]CAH1207441.1 conserved exported hypothetical protein [Candidatus Nitrotoga sp. BS]